MYSSTHLDSAIISLDAYQVFDQVEWGYMLTVLKRFGFGTKSLSLIKTLYSHPRSYVLTNRDRSPALLLKCGTRQGCCLSPMLFALALEPLAIAIQTNQHTVFQVSCVEHHSML